MALPAPEETAARTRRARASALSDEGGLAWKMVPTGYEWSGIGPEPWGGLVTALLLPKFPQWLFLIGLEADNQHLEGNHGGIPGSGGLGSS